MDTNTPVNKSQRLFIELGTSLLLESGDRDTGVSSELIGMKVGHYLIVRLPDACPESIPADNRPALNVKYLCSGEIFGFASRVILTLDDPDRLLFLEYPDAVESFNVRSHERVDCFLPVQIIMEKQTVDGMIVNINFQGCLCVLDDYSGTPPAESDRIGIRFPMAGHAGLTVQGEVRSLRQKGSKFRIGIRYQNLDSFARSVLGALIPSLSI